MLNWFLLVVLFTSAWAQKLTMDERRKKILEIVELELAEVNRLTQQENFGSPDTLLRSSELNMEKARLWRESENEQFLNIPPEERRNLKKDDYFKKSSQYFDSANATAEIVIKRFPKYKQIGEVYYILAYNYKELGKNDLARKYFQLSSQKAGTGSTVQLKSNIALGDYYFNSHEYAKAIPLYESGLNKIDSKWWTKDAFNLAWCYYRTQRYDKAINLMKEVHRKSSDKKYIDMHGPAERDIGIFFVDSGRLAEAASFYEALNINYTAQFVKIANSIVTQGRFAQAESLLAQAAKLEKDRERRITILVAQLDLFDKYNKIESHLGVAKELMELHKAKSLEGDAFKKFEYQVNKKAAELQKVTASDIYKQVPKVQQEKSAQAIAYFELASLLRPDQKGEKIFFQAETAYAAGNFEKAIQLYLIAFDEAKIKKQSKVLTQAMEGLLAALAQPKLEKSVADKNYIAVYSRYLSLDSKSERASSIFVKLFNAQMDAKLVDDAEKTAASFAKNFPQDFEKQEGMLAKIMEHYRLQKNYGKIRLYIDEINQGKYKVSKKYADALRALMTKIQIEGVQKSLEKGEKDVALQGYHKIFESPESTPKAKTNAAYNLSVLYYEMGDSERAYSWGVSALKEMETSDAVKFSDAYLTIAAGLFLKQSFEKSVDFSAQIVDKLCKENSSNKVTAYKNAVFIALANADLERARSLLERGKECLIPDAMINEISLEVLRELIKAKKWENAEVLIADLEKIPKSQPFLIKPFEELRKVYINLGDANRAQEVESKQLKFFQNAKNQKLEIPVEALDLMAGKMLLGLIETQKKIAAVELKFPEPVFNAAVKSKLTLLDQMTNQVNAIQKLGSGRGIVEAMKYAIYAYEAFGQELRAFAPEGKSPEYLASFQKAMSDVYNPLLANAKKQRAEIKKLIKDNKILSFSNFDVMYDKEEAFKRFLTQKQTILMERGGKR